MIAVLCYPDITLLRQGRLLARSARVLAQAIFPSAGSLGFLALPCLACLVLSCGLQLGQEQTAALSEVGPFTPKSAAMLVNELGYPGTWTPFFLLLFLLRALPCRTGLSTVAENSGLSRRRYQDGGSVLDRRPVWVGTQFGGSAVWASRSPPSLQIEFGSTINASWARLVQCAGTVRRPGLAFPTRAAAERDWLLMACPCCRGMALKRECALGISWVVGVAPDHDQGPSWTLPCQSWTRQLTGRRACELAIEAIEVAWRVAP